MGQAASASAASMQWQQASYKTMTVCSVIS